ncbi:MAG TPA: hypothetical protein VFR87_03610 [Nocardioidaceae bacterium]|nr:hypothetical protein [Nocardioidaceae bacterium]
MAGIPSQRQQCVVYAWCTAVGRGHRTHVSKPLVFRTAQDPVLQVSLTAENQHAPFVHLEAAFASGEALMEIAELEPAEAVELAGLLLRLARTGHADSGREAHDNAR